MNNQITSPCVLARTVRLLNVNENDGRALVEDRINGDVFNALLSDIRYYTYQGEELLLVTGEVQ